MRSGFDTGTAGVEFGAGGDVAGAGAQGKSKSGKACTLPQKVGRVGSSAFEREFQSRRMRVGIRSRYEWGFGSSGSKRSGHGSCMTVEGFARMRSERCILPPCLVHYGSGISTTLHHGDSPSRVVEDYC